MAKKTKEIVKVEEKAIVYTEYARDVIINNVEENLRASQIAKEIITAKKKLKAHYRGFIDPAYKVYKGFLADEKIALAPFEEPEKLLRKKIGDFETAERKRIYDLEQKAIREAEAKEKKRKEELEEQAKRWEEKGNIEKAEERREMAEEHFEIVKPVPVLQKNPNVVLAKNLVVTVTDKVKFIQSILDGVYDISCIDINNAQLKKEVRQTIFKHNNEIKNCIFPAIKAEYIETVRI